MAGAEQQQRVIRRTREELTGDIPTLEELNAMSGHQRLLFEQGTKLFVRGKGLMTRHQLKKHLLGVQPQQAPALRVADPGPEQRVTRSVAAAQAGQAEPAGEAAVIVADQNLGYYYSDILPVRCVAITTMTSERESEPIPYSPQYQILAGRLNDPAQTGVLSSVVRGPNVRDATTMTSLVKAMAIYQI